MKNYRVTVNGNVYEVCVEEVGGSSAPQAAAPKAAAPKPAAPAPAPSASAAGQKVTSPLPGTVVDVKVGVGSAISKNQVVIILEAMKMENEIVSPYEGKLVAVNVNKGDSVNTGDHLFTVG